MVCPGHLLAPSLSACPVCVLALPQLTSLLEEQRATAVSHRKPPREKEDSSYSPTVTKLPLCILMVN